MNADTSGANAYVVKDVGNRQTQVSEAISYLAEMTEKSHQLLGRLGERLEPVISAKLPTPPLIGKAATSPKCKLAQELFEAGNSIDDLHNKMERILNNLEL